MAAYATQSDLEAYVEGWVTDDAVALERWLGRAERAVDRLVGPWGREANGLKFGSPVTTNEKALTLLQRQALSRATCAQAHHMITEADREATGPVDPRVASKSGPDFSVEYRDGEEGEPTSLAPEARAELAGYALIRVAEAVV